MPPLIGLKRPRGGRSSSERSQKLSGSGAPGGSLEVMVRA